MKDNERILTPEQQAEVDVFTGKMFRLLMMLPFFSVSLAISTVIYLFFLSLFGVIQR